MFDERTSVGLDVHARSVVAEGVDWQRGQVFSQRLVPVNGEVLAWVGRLPGPVAVTYEAGPTGFGLARAFQAAGIRCVVVAPSKLERPGGDRVKTDRRDARRLAHLLHIGELPGVRVPTEAEEHARDLVRAREDVRADLMRARHRVSKLLLRQGIVYCGGTAWTCVHQQWLHRQHFDSPGLRVAYAEALDAVAACADRRERLDAAIEQIAHEPPWAATVARLQCVRGIATLTAFGLSVEIGDWHRFTGASIGAYLGLVPASSPADRPGPRARSPRPVTPTPGGCWSRRPGTTAARPPAPAAPFAPAGPRSRRRSGPGPGRPTPACTAAGSPWKHARNAPPSPPWPWPGNWPAGAGAWPSWTPDPQAGRWQAGAGHRVRNDPRPFYEQPTPAHQGRRVTLDL